MPSPPLMYQRIYSFIFIGNGSLYYRPPCFLSHSCHHKNRNVTLLSDHSKGHGSLIVCTTCVQSFYNLVGNYLLSKPGLFHIMKRPGLESKYTGSTYYQWPMTLFIRAKNKFIHTLLPVDFFLLKLSPCGNHLLPQLGQKLERRRTWDVVNQKICLMKRHAVIT